MAAIVKADKTRKKPEICLAIDDYSDIFSDFDLRPYEERALSHDFLSEAKRAAEDKTKRNFKLTFMISSKKRNKDNEIIITKRLKKHFDKHFKILRKNKRKIISRGLNFTVFGVIIMFMAAYFFFDTAEYRLIDKFLLILLEPAGWFLFWEGLDLVIFESKKNTDIVFYEKMSTCEEINFVDASV